MSESTADLGATELLLGFSGGELSPVQVVLEVLERIGQRDSAVNAFCEVHADQALAAAAESESRWKAGTPRGPLEGVPISVKDTLPVTGWSTGRGSLVAASGPAATDALPVARVRAAGAVLLGSTTSPELSWKGVTDSPRTGSTTNPWDPSLTAGGSSGGSAAAVGLGMGPLSLGTDAGGSVRIPAAFTGTVAHKPTWGHVPHHSASPFSTLAQVGAMGRTVADVALLHDVIAQPDPLDPWSVPGPRASVRAPVNRDGLVGSRIAWSPDLGHADVDPEIAEIFADAVAVFGALGATVERADPGLSDPYEIITTLWSTAAAAALRPFDAAARAHMDPGLVAIAERGERVHALDLQEALMRRHALGTATAAFHREYDLLITPTLPITAFTGGLEVPEGHARSDWLSWATFTFPFNLTGQPAVSVPCGFTAAGLPVGLQIVGPQHSDPAVLTAAQAFQNSTSHHTHRPPLAG